MEGKKARGSPFWIDPLGNMSICTKFHGSSKIVFEIFQSGPKWWTNAAMNGAFPLA